jgi:hypothetical protein
MKESKVQAKWRSRRELLKKLQGQKDTSCSQRRALTERKRINLVGVVVVGKASPLATAAAAAWRRSFYFGLAIKVLFVQYTHIHM